MKQKLRLMAVLWPIVTYMCLEARAQRPEPSGPVLSGASKDTTRSVRDTLMIAEVEINTGYQRIPRERATGSFDFIDSSLFNRRISANVLDRIENLSPGILFDRSTNAPDPILIRGRSTIFADASPLIVLDNFPYEGDISNINPNDVASVTILKDAAAASIWGARAGNGVIVVTTKRGRSNTPTVVLNTNISIRQRPALSTLPMMGSEDFIELERWLFEKGYYNSKINNRTTYPVLSPVIEALAQWRSGLVSETEANAYIESLKGADYRRELENHFYRPGIDQQYAVSFSGNSPKHNYYVSSGYDHGRNALLGNGNDRLSLRSQHTVKLTDALEVEASLLFTQRKQRNGGNPGYTVNSGGIMGLYPYASLVGDDGSALSIPRIYRDAYTDTAGMGRLLDWKYRPLDEIGLRKFDQRVNDYFINAAIRYRFFPWLGAEVRYAYQSAVGHATDNNTVGSFHTRDLINRFHQPGAANPNPVPIGDILETDQFRTEGHHGRFQLDGNHSWTSGHRLDAIAGMEMRSLLNEGQSYLLYGYQRSGSSVSGNVNFDLNYPYYYNPRSSGRIPNSQSVSEKLDRFISVYANAAYTYDKRYTLSFSIRNDAANLIGGESNQRGTPLASAGLSWQASDEPFYGLGWLPVLKLRATYGHNGNISKISAPQATIISVNYGAISPGGGEIRTLPNERLRWERVKMLNLGVDFTARGQVVSGTVEYYRKKSRDLLGEAPLDPTLGATSFFGNVAHMDGEGIDMTLTARPLQGRLSWQATAVFSVAKTKVTNYLMPVGAATSYLNAWAVNPVAGKPIFSVYSYPWHGLDGTGSPVAYLGGEASTSYNSVIAQMTLDSLNYNGPVQPSSFGSLLNTITWKGLSLSFNVSLKLGHYFRSGSIFYGNLFERWHSHADYSRRWQEPGDELDTDVPAMVYPNPSGRDNYYMYSDVLVQRGGQIRLEDVRIGYLLGKEHLRHAFLASLRFDAYMNNLGLIWAANNRGIDPYYVDVPRLGKSLAFGISATF